MSLDLKGTLAFLLEQGKTSAGPKTPNVTSVITGPNSKVHYVTHANDTTDRFDEVIARELTPVTKSCAAFVAYVKQAAAEFSLAQKHKYITIYDWGNAELLLSGGEHPISKVSYAAPFTREFAALYEFVDAKRNNPLFAAPHSPKSVYDFIMQYASHVDDAAGILQLLKSITITMRQRTDLSEAFFGVAGASYNVTVTNGDRDTEVRLPRDFAWSGHVLGDSAILQGVEIVVSTTPNVVSDKLVFGVSLEDLLFTRLKVCEQVREYLAANLGDEYVLLID